MEGNLASEATLRIPAADLEGIVTEAIRSLLLDPTRIVDVLVGVRSPAKLQAAIERAERLAVRLADPSDPERVALLRSILDRVGVSQTMLTISLDRHGLTARLQDDLAK